MSNPKRKTKTGGDWEFKISRQFLDREDLSGSAKWIAVCLRGWCNKSGYAHPTISQISKRSGLSPDTVEKYLLELKKREVVEWIVYQDAHGHRRRRYFMGLQMAKAMGVALPYGHGGMVPPLTSTIETGFPDNALYDVDLNFTQRRETRERRM